MTVRALPDGSRMELVESDTGNLTSVVTRQKYEQVVEAPAPASRRGDVAWYIPHTAVHPATAAAAPPDAVWIDVSQSNVSYYAAMLDIWERGETFAVLEHDIVCRPDVIQAFEDCPEPWCCFGYSDICHPGCMEAWANMLGCTRFRSELIAAVPDAMSSIPTEGWPWQNMCDGLGRNLRAAGFTHHWHFPPVVHHHLTDGVHGPQSRWWEEAAAR